MIGLIDKEIKKYFKTNLSRYNIEYQHLGSKKFTIGQLDYIFRSNRKKRKDSKQIYRSQLGQKSSIANILSASLLTLTLSVYSEDDENGILPQQWISINAKPNPNIVFGSLLTQLSQLSISISELSENGLDNSARIILRSSIELTWQILILLYFRDDLKNYVKAETPQEVKHTWWLLFANRKVQKKLSNIEKKLEISSSVRNSLKNERQEAYQFFSESVHHGFINTIMASIAWNFHSDSGRWNALGGTSLRSHDTLTIHNHSILYFINMFIFILDEFHGTYIEELPKSYWKETLILRDLAADLMTENLMA